MVLDIQYIIFELDYTLYIYCIIYSTHWQNTTRAGSGLQQPQKNSTVSNQYMRQYN